MGKRGPKPKYHEPMFMAPVRLEEGDYLFLKGYAQENKTSMTKVVQQLVKNLRQST